MDKKISQKEYLKKYLSSGKDKKKVKKKKPNLGPKTVKIIDDDIDLKHMRAIEDGEIDIYANTEDGPQIAGIIDERGPVDFSDKKRWKIITDDGFGDISVTSVDRDGTIPDNSSPRNVIADPKSTKNRSSSQDSDCSPPRRSRNHSESEQQRKKKLSSKTVQNSSGLEDSDCSPPRRSRKHSDSNEPPKKKSSSKKLRRKVSGSEDSDFSPPRRHSKGSDSDDKSRRIKSSKKHKRKAASPVLNGSASQDSDFSPPRRAKNDADSDLSPPRNSKTTRRERVQKFENEYNPNSRRREESKYHGKQRENSDSRDSRRKNHNEKTSRNRYSVSPGKNDSYKTGRNASGNISSEYNSRHERSRQAKKRRDRTPESPRDRRREDRQKSTVKHSRKGRNDSDSDLSPPRESKKKSKNFEPELEPSFQRKSKNYQPMSAETSGFGQAPILRDRKTGRRRDLAAEAREQEEKDGKRQELEEKYAQWGRGLKQVEDRQEKLDRDLYEMSKPLARYADDADLERELKAQEREGDPMLQYMKKKRKEKGIQEPEKPTYSGPSMPNRFGIRPGYRWDGVDRSNGYEKKWFEAQNARKAVQEEAYKWSTADM